MGDNVSPKNPGYNFLLKQNKDIKKLEEHLSKQSLCSFID